MYAEIGRLTTQVTWLKKNLEQSLNKEERRRLVDWENKVQISMDSKGRELDNILTERLWRTIKYEEVYLKDYASPREARQELRDYLCFYNEQRIHRVYSFSFPAHKCS